MSTQSNTDDEITSWNISTQNDEGKHWIKFDKKNIHFMLLNLYFGSI